MCGIFGMYDRDGVPPGLEVAGAMSRVLRHRGPDDYGHFVRDGVLLGNCRLSIIDIAGGHQPFVSDDGRIAVVQNGEIFNYLELMEPLKSRGVRCRTQSDTEVLLRLYETEGPTFIQGLNGMFAVAVYDGRDRTLWLYRDRAGVKPLYYYDDGRRLVFASEIKALLVVGVPRRVDEEALHHYLTFNYVPPPLTLFQGVRHLLPGHRLCITPTRTREEAWWNLSRIQSEQRLESQWMEEFNHLLSDAVRLRLRADVPFGAFLSGGIDSGSVVGLMAAHLDQPVKTFSIGFHDPRYDELPHAEAVARMFHTEHVQERVDTDLTGLWSLTVYHCDQPHGDVSFMPTYRLSELAARHVKVVLTGDGGDELFAGYEKYADFFSSVDAQAPPEAFQRAYFDSISLLTHRQKLDLYTDLRRGPLAGIDSYDRVAPLFAASAHMDRINQALYLDTLLLLSGNNLVKPDRMGMAVSIEARTPFLDYRMIEFAFRMPGALKLRGKETKHLYKRAVEGLLSRDLVHRRKQMFTVPVGEWFKDTLVPFLRAALLSPRAVSRGLFREDRVAVLLDEHRSGRANHTRILRALVALEIWFRIFIDDRWERPPAYGELDLPEPAVPVLNP